MYTPCLPLTRSDECVHVVGQYIKPIASTPKSGGGGGGKRRERDLHCNSFTNQWKSKAINQIFHKYDLLLLRLKILPPKILWQSNMFS